MTLPDRTIGRPGTLYYLQATASNVVSMIVPTPMIAPAQGAAIRVGAPEEAPQATIKVAARFDGPVVTWGQVVTVRVTFMEHGATSHSSCSRLPERCGPGRR